MSDPGEQESRKKAYEGSVSVIRCGNMDIRYSLLVAVSRVPGSLCGRASGVVRER